MQLSERLDGPGSGVPVMLGDLASKLAGNYFIRARERLVEPFIETLREHQVDEYAETGEDQSEDGHIPQCKTNPDAVNHVRLVNMRRKGSPRPGECGSAACRNPHRSSF